MIKLWGAVLWLVWPYITMLDFSILIGQNVLISIIALNVTTLYKKFDFGDGRNRTRE